MVKVTPESKAKPEPVFNQSHIAEISGINRANYLAEMRAHISRQWEEYNIDARLAIPYKEIVTESRVLPKVPKASSLPKSWAKKKL